MKRLAVFFLLLPACTSPKGYPAGSSRYPAQRGMHAVVTWSASSGNPASYVVELSQDGGAYTTVTTTTARTATVSVTTTHNYVVRVKATNPAGSSSYSSLGFSP